MKLQRRFAPISGEFTPESVARFIGILNKTLITSIICSQTNKKQTSPFVTKLSPELLKIA